MASRTACDPRRWNTFWSTIVRGTRYRHQVRVSRETKLWMVRTEIWEGVSTPYYNASQVVSDEVGKQLWALRDEWSNIDEEDRPMYPPTFKGGFV